MKATLAALLVLLVAAGLAAAVLGYSVVRRGLSTRMEPSRVEQLLAQGLRRLATPSAVRSRTNPVEATDAALGEALEHFADHCAVCHANDGGGDTEMGRSLYPPAPDMRAAPTQELSDGELFSIIENGIRMTGMPAWGTGTDEGERASWGLVHFIRRLPTLSAEEIGHMEELNPRTRAEFLEAERIRRFLAGDEPDAGEPPAGHKGPHH